MDGTSVPLVLRRPTPLAMSIVSGRPVLVVDPIGRRVARTRWVRCNIRAERREEVAERRHPRALGALRLLALVPHGDTAQLDRGERSQRGFAAERLRGSREPRRGGGRLAESAQKNDRKHQEKTAALHHGAVRRPGPGESSGPNRGMVA